ncbi:iron-sulfur cluster assembly scaffold protein [Leptospira jelokensis]|uniref:iron-sulfur cluster assembly scaffold protein n=1 Tax=Leptospira jelokensis TaxID=2484931 RepID=UPI001090F06D|nr:iron-sulfur cluster assembly scaffold protein [Leptospira jelokensis]TGL99324.1 iron-sulfur cluster assembly scaffold protein [Leptospira jelokensis]
MSLESKSYVDFLKWKSYANWQIPKEPVLEVSALNPLCGDEVKLYYQDLGNKKVKVVAVSGDSCSICSAALGFLYKNQSHFEITSFSTYLTERKKILEGKESSLFGDLEELSFLEAVKSHPSRHKCALLPWQTLLKIIEVNHDPRT